MFPLKTRRSGVVLAGAALLSFSLTAAFGVTPATKADSKDSPWILTWSDEFNGPDGSLPDPTKWTAVSGGSGFGNHELEYYTGRAVNAHEEKGNLVITARKESFTGPDGVTRDYTSARLQTLGHFEQKYGRFEARIKLAKGQGIWSAFWMMGNDAETNGWPACGEMDIVENVGFEPSKVHGSLHGPLYSGGSPLTGAYTLPEHAAFSDDFHLFAVEWEPNEVRFFVDDVLFETQNSDNILAFKHWAFDHPFYILMNLAVGGDWPGSPDATTVFPVTMLVDYVRVYKPKPMDQATAAAKR
jgi:beta-glucanase (GH16 family)